MQSLKAICRKHFKEIVVLSATISMDAMSGDRGSSLQTQ